MPQYPIGKVIGRLPLLLFLIAISPLASGTDPLWNRAVEQSSRNDAWVPFSYAFEHRVFNGRDELLNHGITELGMVLTESGALEYEIQSSRTLEGKPTESPAPGGAPGMGDVGLFAALMLDPFDPDLQAAVTVSRSGPVTLADGRPAVLFDVMLEPDRKSKASGKVWLDPRSALPLRIERELASLPFMIASCSTAETFEHVDGLPTAGTSSWNMVVTFLITRRISFDMAFSDYRNDPQAAALMKQEQQVR